MAKILNVPRYTSGFCHALMKIYPAQYNQIFILRCTRVCLKIHSCHLHAPLCGKFIPHSVNVAHYASLIRDKSPANCDAQLTESNFKTHSENISKYVPERVFTFR